MAVPRYYQLAILEAVTGLDPEQALDVVTRVQRLLQECVKVRRGGEAEQQQRGDDARAAAQSAARSMIVERPARRRGGNRHAAQRHELHDGLRCIASLLGLGEGKRVVEVAREITDRCNRYQPMPVETDPIRREIQRVRNAGVPLPMPRHTRSPPPSSTPSACGC